MNLGVRANLFPLSVPVNSVAFWGLAEQSISNAKSLPAETHRSVAGDTTLSLSRPVRGEKANGKHSPSHRKIQLGVDTLRRLVV